MFLDSQKAYACSKIGSHQNIQLKWCNCIEVNDQTARMRILISLVSSNQYFASPEKLQNTGPSCSKLTMSLVNDSLKFTSIDMQIC